MTYLAMPSLPGTPTATASFAEPIDMLEACHERIHRTLRLLERLISHVADQGVVDAAARSAAKDICRYFDLAAPLHHQDEELHVFPLLAHSGRDELQSLAQRLLAEHQQLTELWTAVRQPLAQWQDQPEPESLSPEWLKQARMFTALYQRHAADEEVSAFRFAREQLHVAALQQIGMEMSARRTSKSKPETPKA